MSAAVTGSGEAAVPVAGTTAGEGNERLLVEVVQVLELERFVKDAVAVFNGAGIGHWHICRMDPAGFTQLRAGSYRDCPMAPESVERWRRCFTAQRIKDGE